MMWWAWVFQAKSGDTFWEELATKDEEMEGKVFVEDPAALAEMKKLYRDIGNGLWVTNGWFDKT